jgi:glyoxylase-like metal-dependent hydrolase (beta-lactamase superfamily II)
MSDEYTGHVDPGGPTASRLVDVDGARVEILKLSVGPMDNNPYVIRDADSVQALLIDAANEEDRLLAELEPSADRMGGTRMVTGASSSVTRDPISAGKGRRFCRT